MDRTWDSGKTSTAVRCPICEAGDCFDFLEVSGLPVTVGALCPTQEQAYHATKGDLKLAFCKRCSYIWNRAYEPGKHDYNLGYEISLHFSGVYQHFLEKLAALLVENYQLRGKAVLESSPAGRGQFGQQDAAVRRVPAPAHQPVRLETLHQHVHRLRAHPELSRQV